MLICYVSRKEKITKIRCAGCSYCEIQHTEALQTSKIYTLSYSRYIQPDREMGGNKYKINMNKMCRENFIYFQLNFYTIEHCLVNLYYFNFNKVVLFDIKIA